MICLGVESTAHTFGVGLVERSGDGYRILGGARDMYVPPAGSGIHPREAADHHSSVCKRVMKEALEDAQKTRPSGSSEAAASEGADVELGDVDVVAFSRGPGMPPCLRAGATFSRVLAHGLEVPLVDVNHPVAHVEIGRLTTGADDSVVVYVSGGNTQIIAYSGGRYRVFGETEDLAIGNALDGFARHAGLQEPGGPKVERLAREGSYVELPYVVKGMDLSFSGIITEAKKRLDSGVPLEDLCFSLQETCFAMLTEVTERAMAHTGKDEVLLTGGVAANARFTEMLGTMCEERGAEMFVVDMEHAGDNGIMIAYTGLLAHESRGAVEMEDSGIIQKWRIDDVEIPWF